MEKNPNNNKRAYQKPKLEAEKVLEVHAATCCRDGSCTTPGRDGAGKDNKINTVS